MNTYKRSPILRGDILYAELGAAAGSEQAGLSSSSRHSE